MTDVYKLYDEIEEAGVLEDRREYEVEDLKSAYQLTDQEADDLHYLVQRNFDPKRVEPYSNLEKVDAKKVVEGIVEGLHSSLDGWDNPHDRVVIERYIDDLALYAKLAS